MVLGRSPASPSCSSPDGVLASHGPGPACCPRPFPQTWAPVPTPPRPSVSVTATATHLSADLCFKLANSSLGPAVLPGLCGMTRFSPRGHREPGSECQLVAQHPPCFCLSPPRPPHVFFCACCSLSYGNVPPPLKTNTCLVVPLTGSNASHLHAALPDCLDPLPEGALLSRPTAHRTSLAGSYVGRARARLSASHQAQIRRGSVMGHWAWARLLSPQADLGSLPEIENSLAVFCMATYGEGDPTDNAQDFYDWLQETDVDLSGVKYAVSQPIFLPGAFPAFGASPGPLDPVSKGKASSFYLIPTSQGRQRCQDRGLQAGAPGGATQGSRLFCPGPTLRTSLSLSPAPLVSRGHWLWGTEVEKGLAGWPRWPPSRARSTRWAGGATCCPPRVEAYRLHGTETKPLPGARRSRLTAQDV